MELYRTEKPNSVILTNRSITTLRIIDLFLSKNNPTERYFDETNVPRDYTRLDTRVDVD